MSSTNNHQPGSPAPNSLTTIPPTGRVRVARLPEYCFEFKEVGKEKLRNLFFRHQDTILSVDIVSRPLFGNNNIEGEVIFSTVESAMAAVRYFQDTANIVGHGITLDNHIETFVHLNPLYPDFAADKEALPKGAPTF